ncbi:YheV family putative zinc ribbon protein [Kangiella geojedonensis]|uniref:DNA-binding protein n=1 Tax=Kangiella geojedonensis TaxID=914150 RepID=A0A0F6RBD7_9GAMM|nr:YheV family putative zinc ribbon protein [Kangiella geojedonensis]AKE51061.1 DNA-binding protein [Kangiella geojedonensis]
MSHKTTPKRFVAGARCPECKEMDSIVCYYEDEVFVRECVECDFRELIGDVEPEEKESDQKEPESDASKKVTPAQIIKIKEL